MDTRPEPKSVKLDISKPKPRRLRVEDPDFIPPDGGWGWLILFACGFSNLSTFPMFQQFGLMFRHKFEHLGITNTQTTTVINLNSAFNSCSGLLNGPIFKTFTYRQVAMFGSLLVAVSLFICTFCEDVWSYLIFFSMCYGAGIGITQSSNALALNTYFKEKRRIATGLSWSTTALGPIVWPYIITAFLDFYGMEGALMIFSGFALHSFMCSLLLQPVEWHTPFRNEDVEENKPFLDKEEEETNVPKLNKISRNRSFISSQYLYNEDDPHNTGYEIIDPGTPMMVRANDGWYSQNRSLTGSRISLSSNKTRGPSRLQSGQNSVVMSKRPSYNNLSEARSKRNSSVNLVQDGKERKHQDGKERKRRLSQTKPAIQEEEEHHDNNLLVPVPDLIVYPDEKDVLKTAAIKLAEYKQEHEQKEEIDEEKGELEEKPMTFCQKIWIFFDFDLFNDPIYVMLMLGIASANFVEINFSIITPMVLAEFEFQKYEIATFMSLLGATDIVVRFFVPFIADRIGWDNKTFFLVGVCSMAFGRVILVHTRTYYPGLLVAVIIGAGKGLRTIFMALVIPGHVSLERLPAASGLQLATSGLLFLVLGPAVGWVRDQTHSYVITLHIMNIMTYITAIAWTIEKYWSRWKKPQRDSG